MVRDGKSKLEKLGVESKESLEATNLKSITGRGIQAEVEGKLVHIGKDDLFSEVEGSSMPDFIRQTVESLEAEGRTTMIVRHGDRYLDVVGLMDTPREAAKRTIARLRDLGIKRMIMIFGDNQKVDDLDHLPLAIGLSRATRRIIRQNLWRSLGMVAFLVPATILGLNIGPAVILHEGSTLVVVFNALRLLAYSDK